ncbi:ComEC/Rec2 family competence protein [Oricola nitratireducens]|uniref:ComEC/Rec2 family competence protein n=1 Tax=Oricola nitratireducens TaxID=2775868 RepID=UPI001866502D|nr:ComEC/Rec2 family competence protein [Oricola nitratireducens]
MAACRSFQAALQREAGLGTAFLFLPVALICGVLVYFSLPVEPAPWNLASGLVVLAVLLVVLRGSAGHARHAALALFVGVVGMALAQAHTRLDPTPVLGSDVTTRLTGRILAIEERANGRTRFTVDVIRTERPELRYAPDRIRVTAAGGAQGFAIGGGIHGVVRLTSPSGPAHPGGYDFAFHSYFDGLGANGFFLGKPKPVRLAEPVRLLARVTLALERLRQSISREIRRSAPGRAGAVSTALVTGNKSGIPDDVTEALRVAGLAHILSISGLHMALVAATVMATLRLGFAFAPNWSSRHPVKKYSAAGALAATAFYLFLAGAGVATQRSFVMLAIMLLALTFDRNAVTMRNLALAAIAVVVVAPHEVTGPGFQMSFAATAALIAVYAGWQDWSHHRERRRPDRAAQSRTAALAGTASRYALGIAVTSLVAGLATGIFASYHFGRIAPYGLLANLAAMPIVTLLVMPIAVAAVVLIPFGLHVYPFKAMAWAAELVIEIAERVAAISPAVKTGQMPPVALLAFAAGLVLVCLFSTRLRWVAVPVFLGASLVWSVQKPPLAVISEDARQFAVLDSNGGGKTVLHVNRNRPNAFILDQWKDAYGASDVVKPGDSAVMACDDTLCVAHMGSADPPLKVAYVVEPIGGKQGQISTEAVSVETACAHYDMVIFAKAPSPQSCANGTPVISAQMLALYGAAEIRRASGEAENDLTVRFALPGPVRPWLDHRRYSRPARNLPEWRRSDSAQ